MPDLIQAVRPAEQPSAIVVDLGPKFSSFRTSDAPGDRGSGRILIEVIAATTDAPAAPAPGPPPAPTEPPPLLDLAPAGGLRTIVIDAGHGGDEHGAKGPDGTLEKDVTLSVARRLKGALEARLGIRALLTREDDRTVYLDERAAFANNNKADLFISLHLNASVSQKPSGAEVFFLSLDGYSPEARRVAQMEGAVLPTASGGDRTIEMMLWEMAQLQHLEQSAVVAGLVEQTLRTRVKMSPRAIQQAPFRVLVGANMPAVLVELGFISNPEEEKLLGAHAYQLRLVDGLVDAVGRYRSQLEARRAATPAAAPAAAPATPPPAPRTP